MKKKFMCMLMAAAMTLSMAACGSKSDDTNTDDNAGGASDGVQTFTVGTSGPLTGDNAIYGMAVKQGVELAVNEINASDSTIKFEFLSQDDEADGEKAVNAYNTMMDWVCRSWLAPPPPARPSPWPMSAAMTAPSC